MSQDASSDGDSVPPGMSNGHLDGNGDSTVRGLEEEEESGSRPEVGWCEQAVRNQQPTGEVGIWAPENPNGTFLQGWDSSMSSLIDFAFLPAICDGCNQVLEGECSPDQPTCQAPYFLSAVQRGSIPEKAKRFMCRNRLLGDCHYAYESLAKVAEREEWTLKSLDGHPREYMGCLRAYLNQQFLRLVEQGKVVQCFNENGKAVWACFCTGLLAESSEELIYAILQRNELWPSDSKTASVSSSSSSSSTVAPWVYKAFVSLQQLQDAKQPWNAVETILDPPEKATFIDDPMDLVYAPTGLGEALQLDSQIWDSFEEHISSFPPTLSDSGVTSQTRKQAVMVAVQRATRIVQNNPLAAVPQFVRPGPRAPGVVQMLLPLKLDADSNDTHLALVLVSSKSRRGGRIYRATKLIPLDQAYMHARILMPLYQPWLAKIRLLQKMDRPSLSLPMNHNLRPLTLKPIIVPSMVSGISGLQGSGVSPGVSPRYSYQLNSGSLSPAPGLAAASNNGSLTNMTGMTPANSLLGNLTSASLHRPSSPTTASLNGSIPMLSQIGSQPLASLGSRLLSARSSGGLQSPKPTPLQVATTSQMSSLNGSAQGLASPQGLFSPVAGTMPYADGGVSCISPMSGGGGGSYIPTTISHQQLTSALQANHLSQSNLRRSFSDIFADTKSGRGTGVSLPLYAEMGGCSTPPNGGGLTFEDVLTPRGGSGRLDTGSLSPLAMLDDDQISEVLQLSSLQNQSQPSLGDPKTPTGASSGFTNPWSSSASPIDSASGLEDLQSPLAAYGSGNSGPLRDDYGTGRVGTSGTGANATGMVGDTQARMGALGLFQQQTGSTWQRDFGSVGNLGLDLSDQKQEEDVYVGFTPQDDLCPKINISQLPPRFVGEFLSGDRHTGETDAERHVEQCFGRYGLVARSLVRENKNHPGKWFAIVEFAYWTDDNIRQRLVTGEQIRFCQFYAGEDVFIRRHKDKQNKMFRSQLPGTSLGLQCRPEWKYTGTDTRAGKPLYKGPCTVCGRESTVPFKPVVNGQPPRCRNCLPLHLAVMAQGQMSPTVQMAPPSSTQAGSIPGAMAAGMMAGQSSLLTDSPTGGNQLGTTQHHLTE